MPLPPGYQPRPTRPHATAPRSPRAKERSAVRDWHLLWLGDFPVGTPGSTDTIRRLFEVGVRWESATPEEIKTIRWMLLRTRDDTFVELMKLLARDAHCTTEILQ